MTRPHVLSTGLSALLFAWLVTGRPRLAFLASLAIAFFHLSHAWVVFAVATVVLGVRTALERRLPWREALVVAAGVAAGMLARPNPLGGARLLWVQIVELSLARSDSALPSVGKELVPLDWRLVGLNFTPMLVLWIGAAVLGAGLLSKPKPSSRRAGPRKRDATTAEVGRRSKIALAASLVLSMAFFAMMLFVARRSYDLWSLFAVLFVAIVAATLTPRVRARAMRVAIVLFVGMAAHAVYRNQSSLDDAHPPDAMKEAAEWIGRHASPGEIVYNVSWDSFPMLFVWNRTNRYVSGMDPVFLWARDPALYYESLHLEHGKATSRTCRSLGCGPDTHVDTHTAIRRDFGASWLFLDKKRNPELLAWVRSDARFASGFENEEHAVFRVLEGRN
jgi:hypothetical protein